MTRGGPRSTSAGARRKLLDAAITVFRAKGYEASSVDELCAEAGVAKGSFFYHFENKEALAVAAADHWTEGCAASFAAAEYHQHEDPLDRVLGYIAFRKDMMAGSPREISCLAGTMVQEVYETSAAIRGACKASFYDHARTLEADLAEVIERGGVGGVTARSLALYFQVVVQGGVILAKASEDPAIAIDSLDHVQRYLELLFRIDSRRGDAIGASGRGASRDGRPARRGVRDRRAGSRPPTARHFAYQRA